MGANSIVKKRLTVPRSDTLTKKEELRFFRTALERFVPKENEYAKSTDVVALVAFLRMARLTKASLHLWTPDRKTHIQNPMEDFSASKGEILLPYKNFFEQNQFAVRLKNEAPVRIYAYFTIRTTAVFFRTNYILGKDTIALKMPPVFYEQQRRGEIRMPFYVGREIPVSIESSAGELNAKIINLGASGAGVMFQPGGAEAPLKPSMDAFLTFRFQGNEVMTQTSLQWTRNKDGVWYGGFKFTSLDKATQDIIALEALKHYQTIFEEIF